MPLAQPKEKRERRIGERLFLKGDRSLSPKAAMVRRPYPPGMHGKKFRRGGFSEYASQLREKQKVRYIYGITDGMLKRCFTRALGNKTRSTADTLAELLERRLDNIVFRAGFAVSRSIARHLVSYGHVQVNGKRVRQPSFQVRIGDVVGLNETSLASPLFQELPVRLKKYAPPEWIELDKEKRTAKMSRNPGLSDISAQQNMALVVEYYSR